MIQFHCTVDYVCIPVEGRKRKEDASYRYDFQKFTSSEYESMKDFFESLQVEYGRCAGKVYVDTDAEDAIHVGWIFERKVIEDTRAPKWDFYIQQTWISIFDPCEECNGVGHKPHAIIHSPWPPEEQECSTSENPL